MESISAYMRRQAFGDYSHADSTTREERHAAALEFAAHEQTRPTFYAELGAQQARERYDTGRATARDLMNLQADGTITAKQAEDYRARHGWRPRKCL